MKGKVIKSKFDKLMIRGEDNKFYRISRDFDEFEVLENETVEFSPGESEYEGKTYLWANKPKESKPAAEPEQPTAEPDALLARLDKCYNELLDLFRQKSHELEEQRKKVS
jgi:hypothetical protein